MTLNDTIALQRNFIQTLLLDRCCPPVIYRLFRSVISARKATYLLFRQMAAQSTNPEMESSNASHKYFIDTLTTAFQVLGGEEWLSKRESEKPDGPAQDDDIEGAIFSNKFSAFSLNDPLDVTCDEFGHGHDPYHGGLPRKIRGFRCTVFHRCRRGRLDDGIRRPYHPVQKVPRIAFIREV